MLRPASAVHTYFMRFPIDVVFLDRALVVLGIADELDPWRAASRRGAKAVLELPAGESCAARAHGRRSADLRGLASLFRVVPGSRREALPQEAQQPRSDAVVTAHELTRRYGEGDTAVDALRGVSLEVARGS